MNPLAALALPQVASAKLIAWAVGLLALLGGWLWLEHHLEQRGASACEAKAAQADAARAQAAVEQLRANDHRAADAAGDFRAAQAAIAARQPEVRHALQDALRTPLACPAAAASQPAVGDVVVPAGAVRRLRDAGAGSAADPAPAR